MKKQWCYVRALFQGHEVIFLVDATSGSCPKISVEDLVKCSYQTVIIEMMGKYVSNTCKRSFNPGLNYLYTLNHS